MSNHIRRIPTAAFLVIAAVALAVMVVVGDFRPEPAAFVALAAALSVGQARPRTRRC